MGVVDHQRRRLVAGTAAAGVVWIAPSVTTFDRVAAATGTCGTAPVQLDWSDQSNNSPPGTITAADGTQVTFTLLAATQADANNFRVRHIVRGTLADLLYLQLTGGGATDAVQVQIDFDRPVAPCFVLVDVDSSTGRWEDTVTVVGTNGGTAVDLDQDDLLFFGTGATYLGTNTVRGVDSAGSHSNASNVDVSFPAPVDRIVLTYSDLTARTTSQYIGIHDLRWC